MNRHPAEQCPQHPGCRLIDCGKCHSALMERSTDVVRHGVVAVTDLDALPFALRDRSRRDEAE